MQNQTKVSLSQAAKMVGIQRSTLYRHIKERGITIDDEETNRPKIDISELIRVYGNKVRTLEQLQLNDKAANQTEPDTDMEKEFELLRLREKVGYLEQLHQTEKSRLEEQVGMLKELLGSEREERRKATALLTDQRSEKEKQESQLSALVREVADIKRAGLFKRLFGYGQKSSS
jgi:hypothetical protein